MSVCERANCGYPVAARLTSGLKNSPAKTPFSVLMSVYHGESPSFLERALASIAGQSVAANEVLIVKDGPLTDALDRVIAVFSERLLIRTVALPSNLGLGPALRHGVLECRHDLIARMDADDICAPDRFTKQIQFMQAHPEVDVLGGCIAEFVDNPAKSKARRLLPLSSAQLTRWAHRRNPMNHMTVMFRKDAVLAAGNYQSLRGFEDYYLWARMLARGSQFANLEDVLVYVRSGNGMYARRGGLAYAREEIRFQLILAGMGFITWAECISNIFLRVPIRLLPSSLRAGIYNEILRDKALPHSASA